MDTATGSTSKKTRTGFQQLATIALEIVTAPGRGRKLTGVRSRHGGISVCTLEFGGEAAV